MTPGNLPTITSSIVVAAGDMESLDDGFDKSLTLVPHEKINVKAIKSSEFLFIAGKPIGEQIARGGPFVMNTKEEILQAVQDYKNGNFVEQT